MRNKMREELYTMKEVDSDAVGSVCCKGKCNFIRLSPQNVSNLFRKKICCVEKDIAYFEELCAQYGLADQIEMVVDDNPLNQGEFVYNGRAYRTYPLQYLKTSDLTEMVILITSDYYREYFDKLAEVFSEESVRLNIFFYFNKETRYEMFYRDRYARQNLKDIMVFRSGPHAGAYVEGMDFADNARALFEYVLSIGLQQKYHLVWIVKDPQKFNKYTKYRNVSFLSFDDSVSDDEAIRERYYTVLCLAKYFFFTDAYGFVRNCRSDQIRVQLWHGCGYKRRLNHISCEKRYEYMTVTSDLYAKLHAKEFGLRDDQVLVTGCAKADWLFQDAAGIKSMLHIPDHRKYIFWMPTYRFSRKEMHKPIDGQLNEETGLPVISSKLELACINEKLSGYDILLIIKLHPFQDEKVVHVGNFSHIMVLENKYLNDNDIQINQVMGIADALISDYSSTAVDYLTLNRPMAFLVEDAGDYSKRRGYIFDNISDWMPGKIVSDMHEFLEFIAEIGSGVDEEKEKRSRLRKMMHKYPDGNSCKRILESLGIL